MPPLTLDGSTTYFSLKRPIKNHELPLNPPGGREVLERSRPMMSRSMSSLATWPGCSGERPGYHRNKWNIRWTDGESSSSTLAAPGTSPRPSMPFTLRPSFTEIDDVDLPFIELGAVRPVKFVVNFLVLLWLLSSQFALYCLNLTTSSSLPLDYLKVTI
ncbi:uncharacterized protein J3R85_016257 [Psidium guajava]|nr:uncharacterized protein J3R85_016257 [Psidium guajava]